MPALMSIGAGIVVSGARDVVNPNHDITP